MFNIKHVIWFFCLLSGCSILSPNISQETVYFHEVITLDELQSNRINNLTIDIKMPENYKLLVDAKPMVVLKQSNGEILKTLLLSKTRDEFTINKRIKGKELRAELHLFYCSIGNEGMCLIKNILYKIPVKKSKIEKSVNLQYTIIN